MRRTMILLTAIILTFGSTLAQTMIQKNKIQLKSDLMTPEALWAMGRIGGYAASPDGKHIAYQVAYYSVKENKSHHNHNPHKYIYSQFVHQNLSLNEHYEY